MNSKDRVLTALEHKEPDRVPIFNSFTPEVGLELSKIFNAKGFELDLKLGHDCLLVELGVFNGIYQDFTKDSYTCRWGIKWKRMSNDFNTYMEMIEFPLKKIEDVHQHKLPSVDEEPYYDELKMVCKKYGKEKAIIGGSVSIFENAWYLRGFQNFLEDLILKEDEAFLLIDKVMEYNLKLGYKIIDAGVDILYTGDDFGMQTGLIISYDMWKRIFLPRWTELFQAFKKRKPDIRIAYHSDGYILPIIDNLIEAGVDILNPIQPDCLNPGDLKKRYGKRLSFWGTIDVQHTLSFGSTDDVEREVKDRLINVAVGGGLILGSTHTVQMSKNAIKNILKFYEVVKKIGNYPITI